MRNDFTVPSTDRGWFSRRIGLEAYANTKPSPRPLAAQANGDLYARQVHLRSDPNHTFHPSQGLGEDQRRVGCTDI
jgi:hypothetical protein